MIERFTAAAIEFRPMTDIPFLESWNPSGSFSGSADQVFNALFTFSITVGAMLAVLMFIIGGLQMIVARDNPTAISKGKTRMKNAILGLLMLLSTFIILNTINPQLTELKFLDQKSGLDALQAPPPLQNSTIDTSGLNTGDYCYSTLLGGTRCYSSLEKCQTAAGSSTCFDQSKTLKQELDSNKNYQDVINAYEKREDGRTFCYKGQGPCYLNQKTCLKDNPRINGSSCPPITTRMSAPVKDARFQLTDDLGNVVSAYRARDLCDAYAIQKNGGSETYSCKDSQ
jgi:hypothetical protein